MGTITRIFGFELWPNIVALDIYLIYVYHERSKNDETMVYERRKNNVVNPHRHSNDYSSISTKQTQKQRCVVVFTLILVLNVLILFHYKYCEDDLYYYQWRRKNSM